MLRERLRGGVWAGLVAAAATAGALAAFSLRQGDVLRPFRTVGADFLLGVLPPWTHPLAGLLLHVAVAVLWGGIFAFLAAGWRGVPLVVTAAAIAVLAAVAHARILPMLRLGYGLAVFPPHGGPVILLYALYAVAFALGLTLARPRS